MKRARGEIGRGGNRKTNTDFLKKQKNEGSAGRPGQKGRDGEQRGKQSWVKAAVNALTSGSCLEKMAGRVTERFACIREASSSLSGSSPYPPRPVRGL